MLVYKRRWVFVTWTRRAFVRVQQGKCPHLAGFGPLADECLVDGRKDGRVVIDIQHTHVHRDPTGLPGVVCQRRQKHTTIRLDPHSNEDAGDSSVRWKSYACRWDRTLTELCGDEGNVVPGRLLSI